MLSQDDDDSQEEDSLHGWGESKQEDEKEVEECRNSSTMKQKDRVFALVHYYNITLQAHPLMKKPRVCMSSTTNKNNFHVVDVSALLGHAYLVPDFDDLTGTFFWWDKIW